MERRFIEEYLPIDEIGRESAKEKSVRHGHISTLHIWWARRPLISSRTTIFSALIPWDEEKQATDLKLISKLSYWKNSLDYETIESARKKILKSFKDERPKILDLFSGGGSIPLEALRLGCDTYATEYNPVALLILKSTLEYPQKYGKVKLTNTISPQIENKLWNDVEYWNDWVIERTRNDLAQFYSSQKDSIDIGYLWARVINCPNPNCRKEIPIMKHFWLKKKEDESIFLHPKIINNKIEFEILKDETKIRNFDPSKGTISKAICECIACGSKIDGKTLQSLMSQKKFTLKLLAIVYQDNAKGKKKYRLPTLKDIKIFNESEKSLDEKCNNTKNNFGFSIIPDEFIHTPNNKAYEPGQLLYNFTPVVLYGLTHWKDLFNSRQKLCFIIFIEKIHDAYAHILKTTKDEEYSRVITTYLALILDRLIVYNSSLCMWAPEGEFVSQTFGRQALPMVWDYFEVNPFSGSTGSWDSGKNWLKMVVEHLSLTSSQPANVTRSSATNLPFQDNFFDGVFTDPPYYDNVPYSDISDFFYVWLKRSIGFLYPDLFITPLTPKKDEVIAELPLIRGMSKLKASDQNTTIKNKEDFEKLIFDAFTEIHRVLKPDGISIIVYAHKSTEGWETMIKSLLKSGLIVTASWPINTERTGRLRANNSAVLSASIYMVCRKLKKEPIGFYRDVKKELKQYLNKKLEQLWIKGISGADFFISAIGSAIEVFGKYEKIVDDNDNQIQIIKLLNDTRKIVTDYAINKVIKGEFSEEISTMTRFYILWRWAYGEARVPFDDALKMAQSVGIDIEHEWNKGFIVKHKDVIQVIGPDDRTEDELEDAHELIDVLHKILLIWRKGKKEAIDKFLAEKGYNNSDVFKRVAQAISESLPIESTEKKWLDGFLTGFKRDDSQSGVQSKLF